LRKDRYDWDSKLGRQVQIADKYGNPVYRVDQDTWWDSPPRIGPSSQPVHNPKRDAPSSRMPNLPIKRSAPPTRKLVPQPRKVISTVTAHAEKEADEIEVLYAKPPEQVAQEWWVAKMKRDQLKRV
jgi:hypothetical protein